MPDPYGLLLGADVREGSTRFALWTSKARACAVRILGGSDALGTFSLRAEGDGIFALEVSGVGHGARYVFVLDGEPVRDPYAKFLPDGVDMPAMVWRSSRDWQHPLPSRPLREHVIYELHVGTFTPEGTYAAAAARLPALAELGITALELMPIAAFPGLRGWGYDGVAHYAPFAPYGNPDELRAFIDRAHGLGIAVFLDVVYNHFGPAGNVLHAYGPEYFTTKHTPWGEAPNFEHPAMRAYVVRNARYWLDEFRFDGLRFDAVHAIVDDSPKHVLSEIAEQVAELSPKRLLIGEDDRNDAEIIRANAFDAVWADDFHHQVRVALTHERDGYYAAYAGSAGALAETIENGWFYRGAPNPLTGKPRGKEAPELPAESFVYCIQNHDQVGNRALGDRVTESVSREAFAAASLLLLFLPMTPLLFMGQEWGASSPFLFFTDHAPDLGRLIREGRRKEFAHFAAFADAAARETIPDPQAVETFQRSRLDWSERAARGHAELLQLYHAMLKLRASDPVLRAAPREQLRAHAEHDLLVVERWLGAEGRRLLVNFGEAPVALGVEAASPALRTLLASTPDAAWGKPIPARAALVIAYQRAESRSSQ
jgi:maltooligosyltrehalose trehalohydrolase